MTEAMTHDPLCALERPCVVGSRDGFHVLYEDGDGKATCDCCDQICQCDLIAKVRAESSDCDNHGDEVRWRCRHYQAGRRFGQTRVVVATSIATAHAHCGDRCACYWRGRTDERQS